MNITEATHIHVIGIGGIGVSALSRMLVHLGKDVTGTNDLESSDTLEGLRKAGVSITLETDSVEHIPENTEVFVYSVAWDNNYPEFMERVRALGKTVLTFPEALGQVSKDFRTVAVAGTHGKTTTTAMLGHILKEAGVSPHVIVGSLIKDGAEYSNYVPGDSDILVLEAGEYRKAFLNYAPEILILLNIEEDHLDYYVNLENIKSAFKEFTRNVNPEGTIIFDADSSDVNDVLQDYTGTKKPIDRGAASALQLKLPGEHMKLDGQAAIQAAVLLGVSEEKAREAMSSFEGLWRRSEYLGRHNSGADVYDDYGHHPTEIQTTLEGFKERFPEKRLVVVYEPHLYSRTKQLFEDFVNAFDAANEVLFAPIYPAREPFDPSVSSQMLSQRIQGARSFASFDSIVEYLHENLETDDLLIVMGAGDIYTVAQKIVE